ncbi:MAG: glycosyltransferase [SAR86 cluster bacterium]|uniref:Glycosyltransferase n=1 Tax=SAR86 cluster bacterium TaxID=2030880 RepID=A0A520N5T0_9GAMM|nr:MAG: glycosyltransferase [SAR86 cluster bacterium]
MKVVHLVLSEDFAGIEQHVDELLSNLKDLSITLICSKSIASHFNQNISIHEIDNMGRRSLFKKYKLKRLLKTINPDIVHTHGSKTASIISSINKGLFKHVATVHGVKKNKSVYESADYVIGVSDHVLDGIKTKSKVITNWWFPELKKLSSKQNKYALAIGRLEKVKGFDLLISSWVNIETNLIIVGSGKEKKNLLKLIDKYNLDKKIKIIDGVNRSQLEDIYSDASLLIVSSRNEGGPRVALEALYLEIPVLSTNVGHMNKIFPEELLAQRDNQLSLQELLEEYVDNIEILNQSAIFKYIEEEFSVKAKVSEINEVYKSLLSS